VTDLVRRRIFDTLGALVAGREVEASRVLARFSDPFDVRELCATARSSELDDIDPRSCTTPGSIAVPVALTTAAARGGDVAAGVVAGYEAMVAIGEAIDGPHRLAEGVWPSYLAAPVAAAATVARVLDLDAERTAHALAIARTRAVGTAGRIAEEPTSRWLTYGCAATDGVLAALAAEAGMRGDLASLETVARVEDAIERAEVKPFCTARQTLAAVAAARLAYAELGGGPLALVEVGVPAAYRAMIDQPAPRGRLVSIMSAQFQIAAALADEELLYDVPRHDVDLSPPAREIAGVVRVVEDPELSALYPAVWPARVRMRSTDGRESTHLVRDPDLPRDWESLREKHARVGAWGDRLDAALDACRDPGVEARDLLNLARPQEAAV
jgi:2-methylcitrate dehydratase PrpD